MFLKNYKWIIQSALDLQESIKNNYENELNVINKFSDNKKEALMWAFIEVFTAISYPNNLNLSMHLNQILLYSIFDKYLIKIIKNIRLYI